MKHFLQNESHATNIDSPDNGYEDANDTNSSTDDTQLPPTQVSSGTATVSQFRLRPTPKRNLVQDEQANLTKEILTTVNNHFKQPRVADDRFDIYGKNVAMKLRDLSSEQRRMAEKFMNDVLFEAEGGNLTMFHKFAYQPPSHHSPVSINPPNNFQTMYSPGHTVNSNSSGPSVQPFSTTSHQQLMLMNPQSSSNQDQCQGQNDSYQSHTTGVQQMEPAPLHEETLSSYFSSFLNK